MVAEILIKRWCDFCIAQGINTEASGGNEWSIGKAKDKSGERLTWIVDTCEDCRNSHAISDLFNFARAQQSPSKLPPQSARTRRGRERYPCLACGTSYADTNGLRGHTMAQHHFDQQAIVMSLARCPLCGEEWSADKPMGFRNHVRFAHPKRSIYGIAYEARQRNLWTPDIGNGVLVRT